MFDKIADELVEFRRRAQRNPIGPIVQGREHGEGGRKQLEYLWMLGVRRHGDDERGIAPDRLGLAGTTFENRPNIVSAMEQNDAGMAPDAVSRRHARRWLRRPGSGTDTRLRNGKFASRDITQIRRFRGHAAPASTKKIVELPRVLEASDIDRWVRFDKLTHDRGVIGPQELDCPGEYGTDLLHTLLVREACLQTKQSLIDPLQGGIGRFVPVVAKYRAAARQIFEEANLTVQETGRHDVLGLQTRDPGTDARDVVEDFTNGMKSIIALEHDGFGSVAGEHLIEEIERPIGHRMRVRIGEESTLQEILADGHASRNVHLLHQVRRQGVQKRAGIEAMVVRVQKEIFDVEEKPSSGLAADHIEKLRVR